MDICGANPVLEFDMKGISTVTVEINSIRKTLLTDSRLSLAEFGVTGKTKIRLTVTNDLRNLLGPHHLPEGESYWVGPMSFYKERCIWNMCDNENWNDGYCFVNFGL